MTALLMLASTVPGAGADPSGDMEYAQGPSYVTVKGVVGVGVPCLDPAFECDPQPGELGAAQPAVFDVSGWSAGTGSRTVTLWAQQIVGLRLTGFSMTGCSDRNDDGVCESTNDDLSDEAYSNSGFVGDDPCNKDDKDCGDNNDASVTFCVREDVGGGYDEVHAFIGNWADVGFGDNVGAGLGYGTYEVYLQAGATGC